MHAFLSFVWILSFIIFLCDSIFNLLLPFLYVLFQIQNMSATMPSQSLLPRMQVSCQCALSISFSFPRFMEFFLVGTRGRRWGWRGEGRGGEAWKGRIGGCDYIRNGDIGLHLFYPLFSVTDVGLKEVSLPTWWASPEFDPKSLQWVLNWNWYMHSRKLLVWIWSFQIHSLSVFGKAT